MITVESELEAVLLDAVARDTVLRHQHVETENFYQTNIPPEYSIIKYSNKIIQKIFSLEGFADCPSTSAHPLASSGSMGFLWD